MITRETAKQLAKEFYTPKSTYAMKMRWKDKFIDAIYDSFEQQLCSNCAAMELCTIRSIVMEYYPHRVSTFGCTLFRQCK